MSTLNDVQNALVDVITPIVYPNGALMPSIAGTNVYIFPGDPLKLNLDKILKDGECVIAVFEINGMTRNTTRLPREFWVDEVLQIPTLILTVANNTITVSGTITVDESAMVILNGIGYAHKVVLGDTLNTIAADLASQIPGASVIANVITLTNVYNITVRISVPGSMRRILHSQESMIRARIITPDHALREILGAAIQVGIAEFGYYLSMPDLISASIRPNAIKEINQYEFAESFVRDYIYKVEYHTVQVKTFQTIADAYSVNNVGLLPTP